MAHAFDGDETAFRPSLAASLAGSFAPANGPCPHCGGRLKMIGFMPHEEDPTIRLELYRCLSCNRKSDRAVRAEWRAAS
jgi:hypothetical protein